MSKRKELIDAINNGTYNPDDFDFSSLEKEESNRKKIINAINNNEDINSFNFDDDTQDNTQTSSDNSKDFLTKLYDYANQPSEAGNGLFSKGAFKDVSQISDVPKAIAKSAVGTVVNTFNNAELGLQSLGEEIADWTTNRIADVEDLKGNKENANRLRVNAAKNDTEEGIAGSIDKATDKYTLLGNKSQAFVQNLSQTVMKGAIGSAVGIMTGGATIPATIASDLTMFTSSAGQSETDTLNEQYQKAIQNGYNSGMDEFLNTDEGKKAYKNAKLYGNIAGAIEVGTESMFAGLGKFSGAVGWSKSGTELDDKAAEWLASKFSTQLGKNLAEFGVKSSAEAIEELVGGLGDAFAQKLTYKQGDSLGKLIKEQNIPEAMISAAISSSILQSPYFYMANKSGVDYMSGLNQQDTQTYKDLLAKEQTDITKQQTVSEEYNNRIKGQELTDNEKQSVLEQVVKDYDDGKLESKKLTNKQVEMTEDNARDMLEKIKQDEIAHSQDLLNTANQYGLQDKNNTLQSLQEMFNQRNVKAEFDANAFLDKDGNPIKDIPSLWQTNTNEKYGISERSVKLNPYAYDDTTIQDNAMHEVLHDIVGGNTKSSKKLYNSVIKYLENDGTYKDEWNKLADSYSKLVDKDGNYVYDPKSADFKNKIDEEAVAKTIQTKFGSQEEVNRLINTQGKGLFTKMKEVVADRIDSIKNINNPEYRELKNIQNKLDVAYEEAGENYSNNDLRYHISSNAMEDIDRALNGDYPSMEDVKLRDYTPKILVDNGVEDLPMLINQNHLKENILSGTKAKKLGIYNKDANYHNLGKDTFIKAIDNMDNPLAILKSTSNTGKNNSYVIVTDVKNARGEQIIIPIYLNGKGNYNSIEIDTNKIKSVYGKFDIKKFVDNTINSDWNNVIYMTNDKNKKQLITTTGVQFSNYSNTATSNIPSNSNNVNTNSTNNIENSEKSSFNLSKNDEGQYASVKSNQITQDNLGRNLSTQQQEYFKDSKVRDENGLLIPVYHGTNSDFTEFKRTANFYSDNKEVAETYKGTQNGKVMEGYLKIDNPIEINANGEKWSMIDINNISINGIDNVQDFLNKYGASTWNEKGAIRTSTADLVGAISDAIDEGKIKADGVVIKNIYDEGMGGKAGSKLGTDYVTFNSNQFKNIDNKNPTNNPDIRYSANTGSFDDYLKQRLGEEGTRTTLGELRKSNIEENQNASIENNTKINAPETDYTKTIARAKELSEKLQDKSILKDVRDYLGTNPTTDKLNEVSTQLDELERNNPIENNVASKTNFDEVVKPDDIGKTTKTSSKAEQYKARQENAFKKKIAEDWEVNQYANKDLINNALATLENDYATNGKISEETKNSTFEELYNNMVKEDSTFYDEYKDLKKELKNTALFVSDNVQNDIADYNDFRRSNFGKLKLTSDNTNVSVDSKYQELNSRYPELFPDNIINESDRLQKIAEVANEIEKVQYNVGNYNDSIMGKEYKKYAKYYYDTEVSNLENQLRIVDRYNNDRNARVNAEETISTDRLKELYNLKDEAQKKYEKVNNKILLTQDERNLVNGLLNGYTTLDSIDGTKYNKAGIEKAYIAKQDVDVLNKQIQQFRKQQRDLRDTYNQEFIGDLSKIKDKKAGILYSRETATRNIQDIMPKDMAEKVNDHFFKPIQENEANRIRYINEQAEKIDNLDIDTKRKYKYEGQKINEADIAGLWLEKKVDLSYLQENNISKDRIEKIANTFKGILDNAGDMMETENLKAGYSPLNRRNDYFPHFVDSKPDTFIQKMSQRLGIRINNEELPTQIAGITDSFKPGRTFDRNLLARTSDKTDIDALKAMDMYINSASDLIYHTNDIQQLRSLERDIRNSYSDDSVKAEIENIKNNTELSEMEKNEAIDKKLENVTTQLPHFVTWLNDYTNTLANKKSKSDRAIEDNFGRNIYTTMQDVEGKIASNMVGGNLSVAMTNFAPLAQAMGTTKVGNVLTGMFQTTENYINEALGNGDNFVQDSDFLTSRRGADVIREQKASEKISNVLSKPMEWIDNFTSESIVRAKYREGLQAGLNEHQAMKQADEYARNLMADRSKGSLPTIFNAKNPLVKSLTMFQVEPNNMLSNYTKDFKDYSGNKALAIAKLSVASYAFNAILKSIRGGSDILPNPISIVSSLIKMMTSGDDDDKKEEAQSNLISDITGSLPFGSTGVALAKMIGIDLPDEVESSGKIPIATAVPSKSNIINALKSDSEEYKKQVLEKELAKPLLYLGLPTGGAQVNKTIQGIKALKEGGSYKYNSKGEKLLQFPVENNAENFLKSIIFGKYSTKDAQEFLNDSQALNAKQTETFEKINSSQAVKKEKTWNFLSGLFGNKLDENQKATYNNSKMNISDFKEYIKFSKGKVTANQKIDYINKMNISDDDKIELAKMNILSQTEREDGSSQVSDFEYALENNLISKKEALNVIAKAKQYGISLPQIKDMKKMQKNENSLKDYIDYKATIDEATNNREKIELLAQSNIKNKEAIYTTYLGSEDKYYDIVKKSGIGIDDYLDFKSQDIESKNDLVEYLNDSNLDINQSRLIYSTKYSLSDDEQSELFDYINSLDLTADEKSDIFDKLKGYKVNGNDISW